MKEKEKPPSMNGALHQPIATRMSNLVKAQLISDFMDAKIGGRYRVTQCGGVVEFHYVDNPDPNAGLIIEQVTIVSVPDDEAEDVCPLCRTTLEAQHA